MERVSKIMSKVFATDGMLGKLTQKGLSGETVRVEVPMHFGKEELEIKYEPVLLQQEVDKAIEKKKKELDDVIEKSDPEDVKKVVEIMKQNNEDKDKETKGGNDERNPEFTNTVEQHEDQEDSGNKSPTGCVVS